MRSTSTRRRLLELAFAGAAGGLAGCTGTTGTGGGDATTHGTTTTSGTTTDETTTETRTQTRGNIPDSVGLETVATGFEVPLDVAFAPEADRRYVVDQRGRVFVHESDGLREEPFLDLRDAIVTGSETGLLGMALHPNFARNRRAFVRYSAPSRSGTPSSYSHTFVLAELRATSDGRRAKRDSERTLLEIPEPQANHNSGSVVFGPDGYLYVGVGDGGAGGDRGTGHVADWYDRNEGGNGQDVTENLLGSVLRIDVDATETVRGERRNYAVPDDNPLVGREGLDEHYAWGLRNPWGMSFDGTDFLVADVGQSQYEEVNLVERGGNYGWNVREGTHCYGAGDCPNRTPDGVRGGEPLADPVVEYPHSGDDVSGVSVIGGHVYRGSALPGLAGTYVFGDLSADGRLFAAVPSDGTGTWRTQGIEVAGSDADRLGRIYSFGRDADGEVYVLGSGAEGSGLHRIVPAE